MSVVSVGDARDGFSQLLAEVEKTHERVTITRHGRPVAVVLSPDDLESLEETLDILKTPGEVEAITTGVAELQTGKGIPGEDIVAKYLRR